VEGTRASKTLAPESDADREVEGVLADHFVPPSIVVNEHMEIVRFRGKVGPYLGPASGHPTLNLSRMAREDLLVDIRDVLGRAKKEKRAVRKKGVRIKFNGGMRAIDLEVIPVRGQSGGERLYAITFQEAAHHDAAVAKGGKRNDGTVRQRSAREFERANLEIERLREQLHTLIEEHETTLEEFKSANAEILSANEELQSTNEELETTKEELQSSNEELSTVNEELQSRNAELTVANNDQLNLMNNVNLPVVMVGNDLRIRRFTPPAEKILNLLPADLGRRLSDIRSNLEPDNLEKVARATIENAVYSEEQVRVKDGLWYMLRARPYKTWDNKVEGAVITLQDIDSLRQSLDQARTFAEALIENAPEAILVLDERLHVTLANPQFYKAFRVKPEETLHQVIFDLGNRQWDIAALRDLFQKLNNNNNNKKNNNGRVDNFEVQHNFDQLGNRRMILNARRIEPVGGQQMILVMIDDVTATRGKDKKVGGRA
jgi:two-component system, chemotaxis family, CheB/CheR fusion protein